ncbi:MAG: adenylate/guanylate cyclase domain-containing protein [Gallionellaceae bacterium]|nr:adenylate/guanylate cyclase domain-containing protein [Gallionellaceae bacterium]
MKIQFNKYFSLRHFYPVVAGLALVFGTCVVQLSEKGTLKSLQQRIEWLAYNVRLNASLPEKNVLDPRIVIVDIDEKSLKAEGRWPWSREKIANLIDKLFESKVSVVAFDVLFAEPEENPAQHVLEKLPDSQKKVLEPALREMMPKLDADSKLAAQLKGRNVVLGYTFRGGQQESVGQLPHPLSGADSVVSQNSLIPIMPGYSANLPRLQQAAAFGGFFDADMDEDGILRRSPLLKRHGGKLYASLGLEAARANYAGEAIEIHTVPVGDSLAVESVRLAGYDIPTDAEGRVIIPYRGSHPSFPYVSATDVLHGAVASTVLDGTIVFVGTTAQGLLDMRATPMQAVYPGVEVHANIVAGILDHRFPVHPDWIEAADLFCLLVLGVALSLWLPWLSPLRALLLSIAVGATLIMFNMWLWREHGLVMNIATPAILLFLLTLLNMAYGFLSESRGRAFLKDKFGQYVPPAVVDEMVLHPGEDFGFDGDSREMTVLFSDVRNFTTISESLSANELKKLLNEFFTPMTRIIFDQRGTIDKYVGDMIMAFWGAPQRNEQHARYALDAAFDMLRKVEELKPVFKAHGLPEVDIGIGINTGLMNVGDMGSEFRRAYTVIGDTVNLASRLESLTKFYGAKLIVGENTRKGQDHILFRQLDLVRVKGKKDAVNIFEPIGYREQASPELLAELELYQQAIDQYFTRQWLEAKLTFKRLQQQNPGVPIYTVYLERIEILRERGLGPEWDGVYEQRRK